MNPFWALSAPRCSTSTRDLFKDLLLRREGEKIGPTSNALRTPNFLIWRGVLDRCATSATHYLFRCKLFTMLKTGRKQHNIYSNSPTSTTVATANRTARYNSFNSHISYNNSKVKQLSHVHQLQQQLGTTSTTATTTASYCNTTSTIAR